MDCQLESHRSLDLSVRGGSRLGSRFSRLDLSVRGGVLGWVN